MTQQIVQLVDKDGNDIFPVSAGNGEVKIGETLSQPTSVEYVDTDNIVDGAVTADKIDFTTFVPQTANVEINAGFKYGGKTVYAQRFTGSESISANTVKNIALIASGVDSIINAIGWVRPGVGLAKAIIGSVFVASGSSSPVINGGHLMMVNGSTNALQLRIVYSSAQTMSYDITVYYTKL